MNSVRDEKFLHLRGEARGAHGGRDRRFGLATWGAEHRAGQRVKLPPQVGLAAMQLLARTEAIILDPVCSSKAIAGLIDHVRRGRIGPGETLVFLHTGGTPALFAYAADLGLG